MCTCLEHMVKFQTHGEQTSDQYIHIVITNRVDTGMCQLISGSTVDFPNASQEELQQLVFLKDRVLSSYIKSYMCNQASQERDYSQCIVYLR